MEKNEIVDFPPASKTKRIMFSVILFGIFCSAASGYEFHESFKGTFYPGGGYNINENIGPYQYHYSYPNRGCISFINFA
ncbi:hypothetical protein TNIN_324041 [Trichonephila inaurata madagascariensis]|uniref:Uncharacterized protein n=1 Tax=Trichonephila inaurata madagascariensis TaxID=2747483 RepID=A0A8X6X2T5_9ARAC|nr:hypothetical protein TNIN_324041 [Trichonephila inaurata madagascariensis]